MRLNEDIGHDQWPWWSGKRKFAIRDGALKNTGRLNNCAWWQVPPWDRGRDCFGLSTLRLSSTFLTVCWLLTTRQTPCHPLQGHMKDKLFPFCVCQSNEQRNGVGGGTRVSSTRKLKWCWKDNADFRFFMPKTTYYRDTVSTFQNCMNRFSPEMLKKE